MKKVMYITDKPQSCELCEFCIENHDYNSLGRITLKNYSCVGLGRKEFETTEKMKKRCPLVDYNPTRPHASWVAKKRKVLDQETDDGPIYTFETFWTCPICGYVVALNGCFKPKVNFCCECGADMREKENEINR